MCRWCVSLYSHFHNKKKKFVYCFPSPAGIVSLFSLPFFSFFLPATARQLKKETKQKRQKKNSNNVDIIMVYTGKNGRKHEFEEK